MVRRLQKKCNFLNVLCRETNSPENKITMHVTPFTAGQFQGNMQRHQSKEIVNCHPDTLAQGVKRNDLDRMKFIAWWRSHRYPSPVLLPPPPPLVPLPAELVIILAAVLEESAGGVAVAGRARVQGMVCVDNLYLNPLSIWPQYC